MSGAAEKTSVIGSQGSLALIGGRFEADNDALYRALRERCDARIAILSMASGYPDEVGREAEQEFRAQGFYAELVPVFFENREHSAFDAALIERISAFGSVFFTGGDQSRIVETLVQDGRETPALAAIRALHASGGLIAGSSAGAAVMSRHMLLGGASLQAVTRGLDERPEAADDYDAFRLGGGLAFFDRGIVDQHFLARGRIGRLVCAARQLGEAFAFGVDENTALIVRGTQAEVVGETGVILVDLRRAQSAHGDSQISGVRVSYLDDGDALDLARLRAIPATDKKRVRVSGTSYRSPAPVRRNAFASYGFLDLVLRLVEADTRFYVQDSATAFDAQTASQVTLHVRRRPRRSRALRAIRGGEIRYTALDFELDLSRAQLDACPLHESTQVLRPDPAPDARLVLLGNAPMDWQAEDAAGLAEQLRGPVGILATASGEPAVVENQYLAWLRRRGMEGEVLPISVSNIERASRSRALLRTIGRMGTLLLTGGDQRRLTEALLHCADATPVLHSIVTAYERGTPIVAAAASAAALGARMIAEGDSLSALRFGSSEDASGAGAIVERGIGLTRLGLIDQHFVRRRRLGRLLMACAEQRQRFGFGLCEGAGLVIHGDGREIEAIGRAGVVIAELDANAVRLAPGVPDPTGIRLYVLEAGRRVAIENLAGETSERSAVASALLESALEDLAQDYRVALGDAADRFDAPRWRQTIRAASTLH